MTYSPPKSWHYLKHSQGMGRGRPRSGWADGADLWADFCADGGNLPVPVDTHATTIWADDGEGIYRAFAANQLVRTGRGLQAVPTRTNKSTNTNANPTDSTGLVTTFISAGLVSIVDDAAGLAAAGLAAICTAGRVIYVDNRAGIDAAILLVSGGTGAVDINTHVASIFGRSTLGFSFGLGSSGTGISTGGVTAVAASPRYMRTWRIPTSSDTGNRVVRVSVPAGGEAWLILNQVEVGTFASPPIMVAGATATVNGNQQLVGGLGAELAQGVYGFVQVDLGGLLASPMRLLQFSDGTNNNRLSVESSSVGNLRAILIAGTADQGSPNAIVAPVTPGRYTIAFAVGTNHLSVRAVGGSPQTDTSASLPSLDRLSVGGDGLSATNNAFQNTRKLALWFGQPDAALFDDVYARAEIAALG